MWITLIDQSILLYILFLFISLKEQNPFLNKELYLKVIDIKQFLGWCVKFEHLHKTISPIFFYFYDSVLLLCDFLTLKIWLLINNDKMNCVLGNISEGYSLDQIKWIWPNHDNDEPYLLNLTEIETDKP